MRGGGHKIVYQGMSARTEDNPLAKAIIAKARGLFPSIGGQTVV